MVNKKSLNTEENFKQSALKPNAESGLRDGVCLRKVVAKEDSTVAQFP